MPRKDRNPDPAAVLLVSMLPALAMLWCFLQIYAQTHGIRMR